MTSKLRYGSSGNYFRVTEEYLFITGRKSLKMWGMKYVHKKSSAEYPTIRISLVYFYEGCREHGL